MLSVERGDWETKKEPEIQRVNGAWRCTIFSSVTIRATDIHAADVFFTNSTTR